MIREAMAGNVFQFTASYEADHILSSGALAFKTFQFTASYEADQVPPAHMC